MRKNYGAQSHLGLYRLYDRHLAPLDPAWLEAQTILEVGIGETNSSCYEFAARGAVRCYALEPFVPLDADTDRELLRLCATHHNTGEAGIADRVVRLKDSAAIPSGSVDLVLSNSVLEHVADNDQLAAELQRVLRPGGRMLHVVDYRDHFFVFPYHFLLWSDAVWNRFLNPGDLPRWRIGDHIRAFTRAGLTVEVLKATPIPEEFEKVRARIHPRFANYSEQDLTTAYGTLYVTKPA